MREQPTPYERLTDIITEAIRRKKETLSTYTPAGNRIDHLVSEDLLDEYDPLTVVVVAAQMGFDYDVCDYMQSHQGSRARANGHWVELPRNVEDDFFIKYRHQADSVICPDCVAPYIGHAREEAAKVHNLLHPDEFHLHH